MIGFITEVQSVYCAVRTESFICSVWISEQRAIISLHSTNWLVFITEAVFTARYGLDLYIFCFDLRRNSDFCHFEH